MLRLVSLIVLAVILVGPITTTGLFLWRLAKRRKSQRVIRRRLHGTPSEPRLVMPNVHYVRSLEYGKAIPELYGRMGL